MNKSKGKGIDPPQNKNKGMKLPNTPTPITTIGGAYGEDISKKGGLAAYYSGKKAKGGK
jgi:hypothetical protein